MTDKETTKKEIHAWWGYFAGYEPISAVVLAMLMPLLMEALGKAAGHVADRPDLICGSDTEESKCILISIGSLKISSSSFAYLTVGFSAFAQALSFISVGALADYGNLRKQLLFFCTLLGSLSTLMIMFVTKPSLFWLASLINIFINIFAGMSIVFYNSYLPLLARHHPSYLKEVGKDTEDSHKASGIENPLSTKTLETVTNRISTFGFIIGYVAALLLIIACATFMIAFKNRLEDLMMIKICIALLGVWWGIISCLSIMRFKSRAGPAFPKNQSANYFLFSWRKLFCTLKKAKSLPNTFRYLICYFFFSDGYNTLGSAAVLFCKANINIETGTLVMALALSLFFAMLGNFVMLKIQQIFNIKTKSMLVFMLISLSLLSFYGAIGLISQNYGLRKAWEVLPMAAYYGSFVGAIQSFSRVLFSEMIPFGEESEFFALYAVTEKGSAWIGPLAVAIISNYVDGRYGLMFLAILILAPLPLLIFGVDSTKGRIDCAKFSIK